jgi:hypothetical protein
MVAFLSPRKSKVDIVQAIGRAMRRSGDKELGYVLVPLYLEQNAGESIEEAIARTNFEEVWDILQSLQEQDEVLAEMIRDMAVVKGRGKGFDDNRFSERIDFIGPALDLESIRDAVTTRVLERLESTWDFNFGKLLEYKTENGNCLVPSTFKTEKVNLGHWVSTQRQCNVRGLLALDRISRLESIGFEWDPLNAQWEIRFSELQLFKMANGHCRVPAKYKTNRDFGTWVSIQRLNHRGGKLTESRRIKLESIGFEWDPNDTQWEDNFNKLCIYNNAYGHCRIPQSFEEDKALGSWVMVQRQAYRNGKLTTERITKLENIGFEWDPHKAKWETFFEELKMFKRENGHCRVPPKSNTYRSLGSWVSMQRDDYNNGIISEERKSRLEGIGFSWDPTIDKWNEGFKFLKCYKTENGNCRVPQSYKGDFKLGQWVNNQRAKYRKGTLSDECVRKLESLGFEWTVK